MMKVIQVPFLGGKTVDAVLITQGDLELEVLAYPGYARVRGAGRSRRQGISFRHGEGPEFAKLLMKVATVVSKM